MKYGFIGFGNLAKAIYRGLQNESSISFSYVDKLNNEQEPEKLSNIKELVLNSDVIWVCVKPQNLEEVLEELKNLDLKNKIIVSPVAGKSINYYEKYLGTNATIIRIMPNLAMAYGKSVTAYVLNKEESEISKKVKEDLGKLGKVIEISEDKFDLFTAIFGSGPAFLLEIFKVFKDKMGDLEISEETQNDLLFGLVDGTNAYFSAFKNEKSITELVERITSRAGVTEAGLKSFKENNIDKLLGDVIVSAQNRSKEIGG